MNKGRFKKGDSRTRILASKGGSKKNKLKGFGSNRELAKRAGKMKRVAEL